MGSKTVRPKWSDVKRRIKDWEARELVALVKDLFDSSPENRRFLAARFLHDDLGPEIREPYRERIQQAFYRKNGWPRHPFDLAGARGAIREYERATGDEEGTVDLLLYHVETGTFLSLEYGDIDAPFYDSLSSALAEIERRLSGEGRARYDQFRERLRNLVDHGARMGWGYGDHLTDVVAGLEGRNKTRGSLSGRPDVAPAGLGGDRAVQ
jgi:hypothetical protein